MINALDQTGLAYFWSKITGRLATKADLVNGKVPVSQLPSGSGDGGGSAAVVTIRILVSSMDFDGIDQTGVAMEDNWSDAVAALDNQQSVAIAVYVGTSQSNTLYWVGMASYASGSFTAMIHNGPQATFISLSYSSQVRVTMYRSSNGYVSCDILRTDTTDSETGETVSTYAMTNGSYAVLGAALSMFSMPIFATLLERSQAGGVTLRVPYMHVPLILDEESDVICGLLITPNFDIVLVYIQDDDSVQVDTYPLEMLRGVLWFGAEYAEPAEGETWPDDVVSQGSLSIGSSLSELASEHSELLDDIVTSGTLLFKLMKHDGSAVLTIPLTSYDTSPNIVLSGCLQTPDGVYSATVDTTDHYVVTFSAYAGGASSWDDLEDKPFYEEEAATTTITDIDYDREDAIHQILAANGEVVEIKVVRVADYVPANAMVGQTWRTSMSQSEQTLRADGFMPLTAGVGWSYGYPWMMLATKYNDVTLTIENNTIYVPTAGLYVVWFGIEAQAGIDLYCVSITVPAHTAIHKLDRKFVDLPFSKDVIDGAMTLTIPEVGTTPDAEGYVEIEITGNSPIQFPHLLYRVADIIDRARFNGADMMITHQAQGDNASQSGIKCRLNASNIVELTDTTSGEVCGFSVRIDPQQFDSSQTGTPADVAVVITADDATVALHSMFDANTSAINFAHSGTYLIRVNLIDRYIQVANVDIPPTYDITPLPGELQAMQIPINLATNALLSGRAVCSIPSDTYVRARKMLEAGGHVEALLTINTPSGEAIIVQTIPMETVVFNQRQYDNDVEDANQSGGNTPERDEYYMIQGCGECILDIAALMGTGTTLNAHIALMFLMASELNESLFVVLDKTKSFATLELLLQTALSDDVEIDDYGNVKTVAALKEQHGWNQIVPVLNLSTGEALTQLTYQTWRQMPLVGVASLADVSLQLSLPSGLQTIPYGIVPVYPLSDYLDVPPSSYQWYSFSSDSDAPMYLVMEES